MAKNTKEEEEKEKKETFDRKVKQLSKETVEELKKIKEKSFLDNETIRK